MPLQTQCMSTIRRIFFLNGYINLINLKIISKVNLLDSETQLKFFIPPFHVLHFD